MRKSHISTQNVEFINGSSVTVKQLPPRPFHIQIKISPWLDVGDYQGQGVTNIGANPHYSVYTSVYTYIL